jgi:hypothetical protein
VLAVVISTNRLLVIVLVIIDLAEQRHYCYPFEVITVILMMPFVRAMMAVKRFIVAPMLAEVFAVIIAIVIVVKSEAGIRIQMIRLPPPTSPLPVL